MTGPLHGYCKGCTHATLPAEPPFAFLSEEEKKKSSLPESGWAGLRSQLPKLLD